ncbi:MAG: tRNA (adenosine(37)-N6)-threonylcarbamoyltransferase complex ATPase subunit type 1 TsaE [Bacteroidota bacterium]
MEHSKVAQHEIICEGLSQLPQVAGEIIAFGKGHKLWLLEGDLGAGKTTLIRQICEALGVEDNVSSPTFSLVNEYVDGNNNIIYHFDFYRIKDEIEALDIGIEEYLDSGYHCFIEWPSKISSLLTDEHMTISITVEGDDVRKIVLEKYE